MSDHCDSPGDRVPIDEICEHFVVGLVEMTWISKGSGVSVVVLVMVAGSCARIIFNYMWLYNCILITVMLDNKPFWNWIELNWKCTPGPPCPPHRTAARWHVCMFHHPCNTNINQVKWKPHIYHKLSNDMGFFSSMNAKVPVYIICQFTHYIDVVSLHCGRKYAYLDFSFLKTVSTHSYMIHFQ